MIKTEVLGRRNKLLNGDMTVVAGANSDTILREVRPDCGSVRLGEVEGPPANRERSVGLGVSAEAARNLCAVVGRHDECN